MLPPTMRHIVLGTAGHIDHGKTALITGAARGIGLAFAQAYVREGAQVAIADVDTRRLTRRIREKGALAGCIAAGEAADDES